MHTRLSGTCSFGLFRHRQGRWAVALQMAEKTFSTQHPGGKLALANFTHGSDAHFPRRLAENQEESLKSLPYIHPDGSGFKLGRIHKAEMVVDERAAHTFHNRSPDCSRSTRQHGQALPTRDPGPMNSLVFNAPILGSLLAEAM